MAYYLIPFLLIAYFYLTREDTPHARQLRGRNRLQIINQLVFRHPEDQSGLKVIGRK
ncbi:hypothetical protein HGA64_03175 [Candidatus Falkowbacteria bacterium]|nr:hypothetical protein [Candidatus Falkowbacteria bacterium]